MDEKDKQKFKGLKALHEQVERCIDFSKVRPVEVEMHNQRGELLGIVDRLLASTAHDATELASYRKFGRMSLGFGGRVTLTVPQDRVNDVFVTHHMVGWGVKGLMQANDYLLAENKDLKAKIEGENGLQSRNDRQAETIKRKDALLIEKDKEIKELKTWFMSFPDMQENAKLKSALRSTQEDLGELRIELADALEELETANIRLSVIEGTINGHNDDCVEEDDTIITHVIYDRR